MVNRINNIAWQAHQGSVAAMIQLLNEKLGIYGVRTRAIFADGVLQILCEAATVEQLEQSTLIEQIRLILESIAPRNIRRVNVNCRIVREEQLLWLEEINRDRENQLLWSQEITLTQPNIVQQLIRDVAEVYSQSKNQILSKSQVSLINQDKYKTPKKIGIVAGAGVCSLLLLAWVIYFQSFNTANETSAEVPTPGAKKEASTAAYNFSHDHFAEAVRIANQASATGKTATTSVQWLALAAQWQRASDLMGQVSPSHSRYQEAQIRTKLYKEYSEAAKKEAEKTKL
jgi:hypothetical protein